MYSKEKINELLEKIASELDISEALFDKAEKEYENLGAWIDKKTPNYNIDIYPQGSFALGTVVKPLSDNDEYDIDLVCEYEEQYGLSAKQLKVDEVKPLLEGYKETSTHLEEKSRCWRIEYDHFKGFHLDVIPSYKQQNSISITHKSDNGYYYIGSNPKGYASWFIGQMKVQRQKLIEKNQRLNQAIVLDQASVVPIKEYKLKTPLQKAIQILKRHRDIVFINDNSNSAPVSIVITTIAGHLYDNQDNILDTIDSFLSGAESWVYNNMRDEKYYIENPSLPEENFADKWNDCPEKVEAFFRWIRMAKVNLVEDLMKTEYKNDMANKLKTYLGERAVTRVFDEMAKSDKESILSQNKKIVAATGAISERGTIPIPRNHHYGK